MKRAGAVLLLVACAGASALAQENLNFENPYALKKKRTGPAIQVDEILGRALAARVKDCYQAEQGKPLTPEESALLDRHAADVARELMPGFESTACLIDQAPSKACLSALSTLSCATLAQPIISAGWDRNLTPEAKAQVLAYAKALAARRMSCEGRDAEEAAIVGEVEGDKLSVLIESKIVTGQCELTPGEQARCDAKLQSMNCGEFNRVRDSGKVSEICTKLLRCRDMKVDTDAAGR